MHVLKPRNRQDPQLRRAQIIEQAIDALGERGYFGFTLKDLAERCGLTNPGLLHYFPSKEHVLLGVLEDLEAREIVLIQPLADAALSGAADSDGRAAVWAVLGMAARRAAAQPRMVRLLAELQSEALNPNHPAHAWWQRRIARTIAFYADLLRPFVTDAEARARLLLAMMDGLSLHWLHAGQGFDLESEWKAAVARVAPELAGDDA